MLDTLSVAQELTAGGIDRERRRPMVRRFCTTLV